MESNNAIVVELQNVRPHPNADRLKLATVVGDQVVVGLDAKDGDVMVYFDSNLCLTHFYLHRNNLYSNEGLNADPRVRGYFGKNGRVRAQQFRGQMSNGFVAELSTLGKTGTRLVVGDCFTRIDGEEICKKYIVPVKQANAMAASKKARVPASRMFWKHWDTKHLLRESYRIPQNAIVYLEEKIHGTSARTGNVLCPTPWWNFWCKEAWRVVSGTRNVDNADYHLSGIRKEIHKKVAGKLRKGEQIYYEIFGNSHGLSKTPVNIQKGFPYGCALNQYRVVLYRVTLTSPDGLCVDLPREAVYQRADELGLERPPLLGRGVYDADAEKLSFLDNKFYSSDEMTLAELKEETSGKSISAADALTLLEGIVAWFQTAEGKWTCLKLKSDEYLRFEDKQREKGIGDVEDSA